MEATVSGVAPAPWGISAASIPRSIKISVTPLSNSYTRSIKPVSIAHSLRSFSLNAGSASESASRPCSSCQTLANAASSPCSRDVGSTS